MICAVMLWGSVAVFWTMFSYCWMVSTRFSAWVILDWIRVTSWTICSGNVAPPVSVPALAFVDAKARIIAESNMELRMAVHLRQDLLDVLVVGRERLGNRLHELADGRHVRRDAGHQ